MGNNLADTYKEEAYELLDRMEKQLLELETSPDDKDLIDSVFRALHTIKGSGSMFGFDAIAGFTHDVETAFDGIRKGQIEITKHIIDLTLAAADHIRFLLDREEGDESESAQEKDLIQAFKEILGNAPSSQAQAEPAPPNAPATTTEASTGDEAQADDDTKRADEKAADEFVTFRIVFRPSEDIFLRGVNPLTILHELSLIGEMYVFAHLHDIPELEELNPEKCYSSWTILLTTDRGVDEIKDAFIFVEDFCDVKIDEIDDGSYIQEDTDYKRIGDILVERGDISKEDLQQILDGTKRFGDAAVETGLVSKDKVETALEEQKYVRQMRKKRKEISVGASTIRVSSKKLDDLANLMSELVTLQARLTQHSALARDPELFSISEDLERLTTELRDNTMSIRMVPIGETFSSLHRLVRDLSHELSKEVEITMYGAETELDKNLVEYLKDPAVHIIRNSLDHGLETPEERERAGKPKVGKLELSAEHAGANVLIRISDDGRGLNTERIRKKAIDRGLIPEGADLTDEEVNSLIFAPGFSTKEAATSLSGRGVGMDVVKANIEKLRGSVEVDSTLGEGTTITLKLPLTLAIIDGLLAMINDEYYVINLSIVDECVEFTKNLIGRNSERRIANVRGEFIPYINLRETFEIAGPAPAIREMVVANVDNHKVGLVVDKVVGQHQTVIKSLGRLFQDIDDISGATILGDGTIALILDVKKLAKGLEPEPIIAAVG